jgi:hypothetical protein
MASIGGVFEGHRTGVGAAREEAGEGDKGVSCHSGCGCHATCWPGWMGLCVVCKGLALAWFYATTQEVASPGSHSPWPFPATCSCQQQGVPR